MWRSCVVRGSGPYGRKRFEIVEVLVVGTVLGDSIMAAKPAIYFSLLKIDERAV
jgi:hypothetical protein